MNAWYVHFLNFDLVKILFLLSLLQALSDNTVACLLTAPCSSNCDSSYGCWGSLSEQCGRCRNYTDLTNANGKVVPEWIVDDNGNTYPGNNVSTCVEECDFSKG